MEKHKHINLSYLKELSAGSNSFIIEMIDAFFEQIPKEIENLEHHLSNNDWQSLRGTAHKIKPSIAFMGIKELEPVIKLTEENAKNETNLEQLPNLISTIRTVCYDAMEELKKEKELFM
jgi:HPt (histidine-containing phosphotransfer) domain-containing protein